MYRLSSSVRRILKRGARTLENLRKTKGRNEHFWPKIFRRYVTIFLPKLGEDQKKKSSLKFSPIVLGVGQKQTSSPTISVLKASAQVTKRGEHFAILHTKLC